MLFLFKFEIFYNNDKELNKILLVLYTNINKKKLIFKEKNDIFTLNNILININTRERCIEIKGTQNYENEFTSMMDFEEIGFHYVLYWIFQDKKIRYNHIDFSVVSKNYFQLFNCYYSETFEKSLLMETRETLQQFCEIEEIDNKYIKHSDFYKYQDILNKYLEQNDLESFIDIFEEYYVMTL